MTVANLADIPTIEDSVEYCQDKILPFLRYMLPTRKLLLANTNTPVETIPYVTVRFVTQQGDNDSPLGNYQVHKEQDETGVTTYIYEYQIVFEVRAYKGNAFGDLSALRQVLKSKEVWYTYFGIYPEIGVRSTTIVTNTPTPVDQQEWETGAVMNITLSHLTKYVPDINLGIVNQIDFTTIVDDAPEQEADTQTGSVIYPPTP